MSKTYLTPVTDINETYHLCPASIFCGRRDSSVGTATGYGLDEQEGAGV
jgi:hypothetical protein